MPRNRKAERHQPLRFLFAWQQKSPPARTRRAFPLLVLLLRALFLFLQVLQRNADRFHHKGGEGAQSVPRMASSTLSMTSLGKRMDLLVVAGILGMWKSLISTSAAFQFVIRLTYIAYYKLPLKYVLRLHYKMLHNPPSCDRMRAKRWLL